MCINCFVMFTMMLIMFEYTDLDALMVVIHDQRPFWGRGQPRQWHAFMAFGHGRKVVDSTSEANTWTLLAPNHGHRKRSSRANQRSATKSKRQKLRDDADAEFVFYCFVC